MINFPANPRCEDADEPMECKIDSRYFVVDKPGDDPSESPPRAEGADPWSVLDKIKDLGFHYATRAGTTISLSDLQRIDPRQHGLLAELCFRYLRSSESAIAVKAYSMEIIYRLALIYPELSHELAASINMLQGEGSAGIKARGRMILNRLSKPLT